MKNQSIAVHRVLLAVICFSVSVLCAPTQAEAQRVNNAPFIRHLYHDYLGRSATGLELLNWVVAMGSGVSQGDVATTVVDSTEGHLAVIDSLFRQFLRRPIDPVSRAGLLSIYAGGGTTEKLMLAILSSAEYYNRAGGTPLRFVNLVYFDLIGRYPSIPERDFYIGLMMTGASQASIAKSLISNSKTYAAFITRLFTQLLHRSVTGPELNFLALAMQSGLLRDEVYIYILSSNEYLHRP